MLRGALTVEGVSVYPVATRTNHHRSRRCPRHFTPAVVDRAQHGCSSTTVARQRPVPGVVAQHDDVVGGLLNDRSCTDLGVVDLTRPTRLASRRRHRTAVAPLAVRRCLGAALCQQGRIDAGLPIIRDGWRHTEQGLRVNGVTYLAEARSPSPRPDGPTRRLTSSPRPRRCIAPTATVRRRRRARRGSGARTGPWRGHHGGRSAPRRSPRHCPPTRRQLSLHASNMRPGSSAIRCRPARGHDNRAGRDPTRSDTPQRVLLRERCVARRTARSPRHATRCTCGPATRW